jgi:hypothetical protein
MKLNEALLIGGALLATLVLSKGGAASSNNTQFSGKSAVPVLPIEDKAPIFQIPKTISQITKIIITPPKVTQIDITDQLKNIFNIETEKKDQRVSYLQDELDQTRAYIDSQLESGTIRFIQNLTGRQSITDQDIVNYYEKYANNPFHKSYGGLTNYYDYIISTRNITKAEVYAEQQQEGINLVEEEYQTRFGGLSRYG